MAIHQVGPDYIFFFIALLKYLPFQEFENFTSYMFKIFL